MKPTPELQLEFLTKLQRLFAEGDFAATYKFALLISLADLAVELGHDDDTTLKLSYKAVGLKFIQLYWQQSAPYKGHEALAQNLGAQAAVVRAIADYRREHPSPSLHTAQGATAFNKLLTAVSATVKAQPIQYIQNLGGGKTVFLFDTDKDGITLLPGVAFCLRRFQPLVQQLSRSHWIDHIKSNKQNSHLLVSDSDLESFLFETSRQALTVVATGLRKICNRCHYCHQTVTEADVVPPIREEASPEVLDALDDAMARLRSGQAVEALGMTPTSVFSNGGLDANWLDKHGVPTVTIGAGQYEIHTIKEYVDLPEFARGCRLAIELATR